MGHGEAPFLVSCGLPATNFLEKAGPGSLSQKLPTFSDNILEKFLTYPPVWEPVRGGNDPGEGVGVSGGLVTPRRAGGGRMEPD